MSRTIAIGDIHGGLKALEQLLALVQPSEQDVLIFLGDYVDGWSQSAQVIDFLIALDKQLTCIFIKGNHDVWCEAWLTDRRLDDEWLASGGQLTIASYNKHTPEQLAEHLAFFNRMREYYIDQDSRLFIHAGFTSMHGPARERCKSSFTTDRTLWEMAISMDNRIERNSRLYPRRLLLFNEVFIGHTPTINYDITIPMQGCNIWNTDTGAAFTGRLSAIDIQSKQHWQSDIVQTLYPDEKGRNK